MAAAFSVVISCGRQEMPVSRIPAYLRLSLLALREIYSCAFGRQAHVLPPYGNDTITYAWPAQRQSGRTDDKAF